MSLWHKRSPGPPWLPIPGFSDKAQLVFCRSDFAHTPFVCTLAMVDRSFTPVSVTFWTDTGTFGARMGIDEAVVPNPAEWWMVALEFVNCPPFIEQPWELFRVRWRLHV